MALGALAGLLAAALLAAGGPSPGVVPGALQQAANGNKKPLPAKKPPGKGGVTAPPAPPPLCEGDYADSLPPEAATRAGEPRADFVFAIRNVATYEHVYYGHEGKLRRAYLRTVAHGTGFAYKAASGETWLVTNEHVASRPDVTDDEHTVEGVPMGSKKVREQLKIVRDESDDYEPGHTVLTKVFSDPASDIAVLRAKKTLPLMPWRLGRSSALRAGNLVQVRGFPLGAFAALSSGKIVNPYTEDNDKSWSHADFVIDALLSGGNSGSPVFAVSCRTGEPELIGVFHAGYTDAAALNVVVAIDQLKEELETLKVPKREQRGARAEVTAADRDHTVHDLFTDPARSIIFPFAGRAVRVQLTEPGTLRFSVLDEDYPLVVQEAMALIDRAQSGYGTLDAVVLMNDDQPAELPAGALDSDVHEHFDRLYDSLWHQLLSVTDYRQRVAKGKLSEDAFSAAQNVKGRIKKHLAEQKELLGLCSFDADKAGLLAGKSTVAAAAGAPGSAPATLAPATLAPAAPAPATPAPATLAPAALAPAAPAVPGTAPESPALVPRAPAPVAPRSPTAGANDPSPNGG